MNLNRELPVSKGALVAVALVFVIGIGGYFGLLAPTRREVARVQVQLQQVEAKLAGAAPGALAISDVERAAWQEIDNRLRERFVAPEDQLRAVAEAVDHARAAGLVVIDVEIQSVGPDPRARVDVGFPVPASFTINPGVIRLTAQHRYRDLVEFLDRLRSAGVYMAIESLNVRRVDAYEQSEIRLVSLRWQP